MKCKRCRSEKDIIKTIGVCERCIEIMTNSSCTCNLCTPIRKDIMLVLRKSDYPLIKEKDAEIDRFYADM